MDGAPLRYDSSTLGNAGFVCVDAVSTAGVCGLMGDLNSCEIGIIHLFLCVKSGLIIPIQPELISFQHI